MAHWDPESTRTGTPRWFFVVAIIAVTVAAAGGYLLKRHYDDLHEQVATLQAQLNVAVDRAGMANEQSQAALARATLAERNAQEAAHGRIEAEQASAEAAAHAADASAQAQQARQQAAVANEQAQAAQRETAELRARRESEIESMRQALSRIAETERTPLGLVMRLGSDSVRFDFDKADIRSDDREILSRIAGVLLASYGFRIQVYGHTDDVGTVQYNQQLSERRAKAVRDYFVDAGIDPDIISSRGYGKSSPRVPGTGNDARARNRRVEIAVIDTVIDYGGEALRTSR